VQLDPQGKHCETPFDYPKTVAPVQVITVAKSGTHLPLGFLVKPVAQVKQYS